MPRDAAPAPIHATISVVVDVNKLGLRLLTAVYFIYLRFVVSEANAQK